MLKVPKILALIPARGGSKGIPRKNIKLILGKPLIAYTIEAANKSKYIDKLVVSTEDEEIANVTMKLGVQVIKRPAEFASDSSPMNPVMQHAVEWLEKTENYKPDLLLLLHVTSPLREAKHIDEALEKYFQGDYDSMMSTIFLPVHRYEIDENDYLVPTQPRRNRQQRTPTIIEDGAIYISEINLIKQGKIVGDKLGYYKIEQAAAVDINEPIDFVIAEQLIISKGTENNKKNLSKI